MAPQTDISWFCCTAALDTTIVAPHNDIILQCSRAGLPLMLKPLQEKLMNTNFEQVIAAQTALLNTFAHVGQQALEASRKLAELNVATAKTQLVDGVSKAESLLKIKDAGKIAEFSAAAAQPANEALATYAKNVYDIARESSADILATVQEQVSRNQALAKEWLDAATKQAPAGSEPVFNAAKQAFALAQGAYEKSLAASQDAVAKVTEYAQQAAPAAKGKARR
jgi:phasin family protein